MMRRFDQNVSGLSKRQEMPALQFSRKAGHYMIVRTAYKLEWNACPVDPGLQLPNRLPDLRTAIMVKARQNVRRASDALHPLTGIGPRHRQRHFVIAGSIVYSGKKVTVEIEHLKTQ